MRQDHGRVGQNATPVAGVMAALAQVHDQVHRDAATRAQGDVRDPHGLARAVQRDEHVRHAQVAVTL